ncbi:MAG: hypothetical protein JO282_11325 [Alphaproteobacteria bacterium]|nr:hypothetical protein [Alphaproteobacteria bacterium]
MPSCGSSSARPAADFFGFHDRGRLQPGKRADINLIAFATGCASMRPRSRTTSPPAASLVQWAKGYEATLIAGTPVFKRGPPAPRPAASCAAGGSDRRAYIS